MEKDRNPFISAGYIGPEFFCDRKEEAKLLTRFMLNRANVTLFAIRRLGKTGLIHHVFYPYRNSTRLACIYLDILSTRNLTDFTNQLATAIYNRFPPQKSLGKKIMELFQRFRPAITFDELTGSPSITLTIETKAQKENTLAHILQFLDGQNIRVVFAVDEFQQILQYPETNTEALIRTQMQRLKNTSFIFCGSNQKMMHEIFNSAKRPFFASCTNLSLDFIEVNEYKSFIRQKFREHGRTIDDECLEFICSWTRLHTFYTQYFCFLLFAKNKKHNALPDAFETALSILKLNENTFYQYRSLLTEAQWNLLRAIAGEEQVFQPQSKKFIGKYGLGTPALVKRGIDALLNKDIIFYNTGVPEPYYEVYDKYLMRWLQQNK